MFIEDKIAKESMTTKISTPKIIFFDIDDTLSRNGIIAEHNKATLEQLADTDIKLVISTGRSKAILPEDILALLDADILDAIICMNGQYSFDKSGRISHYPLTAEQTDKIVRLCQQSDLIHKFDSATHIAWSGEMNVYASSMRSRPTRSLILSTTKQIPSISARYFLIISKKRCKTSTLPSMI